MTKVNFSALVWCKVTQWWEGCEWASRISSCATGLYWEHSVYPWLQKSVEMLRCCSSPKPKVSPLLLSHHGLLMAYASRSFSASFCAPWLVQAGPFRPLFTCAPARESGWPSGYQPLWALGLFTCSRSSATTVFSFNSTVLGLLSCEAVSASPLRTPETLRWLYEVTGISPSLFCVKT